MFLFEKRMVSREVGIPGYIEVCVWVARRSSHIFFCKQKTAYEIRHSLVGSEMCMRDSVY